MSQILTIYHIHLQTVRMCLPAFSRTQTHFSKEPKCFLAYRKLIMDPSHKLFRSLTNWRNVAKKKNCAGFVEYEISTRTLRYTHRPDFELANVIFRLKMKMNSTHSHMHTFSLRFFFCSCPEGAKARSISKSQRNNKQFEQSAMFQFHVNHIANASDASIYIHIQTTETITFAFGCHLFHKSNGMRAENKRKPSNIIIVSSSSPHCFVFFISSYQTEHIQHRQSKLFAHSTKCTPAIGGIATTIVQPTRKHTI